MYNANNELRSPVKDGFTVEIEKEMIPKSRRDGFNSLNET
jgi:hypothetical protein